MIHRRRLVSPVLLGALVAAWAGPASAAPPATVAADAAYWTAGRLAAVASVTKGPTVARGTAVRRVPAGIPQGRYVAGIPQVGTFFVASPDGNTSCTGSVVHSPAHDLVLTAGHCAYGWQSSTTHRIFVPAYAYGKDAAHQPYGFYPVTQFVLDPRYRPSPPTAAVTDLDFAFARLGAGSDRRQVEDVTKALALTTTPSYRNTVTVIGYPGSSHNPGHKAIACTVPTTRLAGYRQMRMVCGGFFDGVSGSPWIAGYDPLRHTGQVIGEVGGRGGGGDDQDHDWISYSPMFGSELLSLYHQAVSAG
ncbi:trypsin-like serine peptidase [Actinoplanes subtropicus]|uniref:trypsin-like serine peptidase n=1 Tax=Actinoplanes subtropicus TaxID=543632 RepID=UPI0012F878F7|nr:trypsin-like serine protease [Actinoplanes subtropicus]